MAKSREPGMGLETIGLLVELDPDVENVALTRRPLVALIDHVAAQAERIEALEVALGGVLEIAELSDFDGVGTMNIAALRETIERARGLLAPRSADLPGTPPAQAEKSRQGEQDDARERPQVGEACD